MLIKNKIFIIAEAGVNHNGKLSNALKLVKLAKNSGADAIKLQTYKPESMTIDSDKKDFIIEGGLWDGYKLFDLYKEAHTPYDWFGDLFDYARKINIPIFSTPFDETAVDLLEDLKTPAYKIASFELTDLPLIKYVAKKRKPMLISTGMASLEEINEALNAAKGNGAESILLFHCISSYPAPTKQANLRQILNLKEKFGVAVGLSDHTIGNTCAVGAISIGACAIEKHFTLDKNEKGNDHFHSMDIVDLKLLKKDLDKIYKLLGNGDDNLESQSSSRTHARRSLVSNVNIKKGEKIKKEIELREIPDIEANIEFKKNEK